MSRHIHKLNGKQPDTHNQFPTPKDIVDKMIASYGYALKGKSIHCLADDYQTSWFYKCFKAKFDELGLTKLYATKYVENSKGIQACFDGVNEVVKELDDDGSMFNECSKATTAQCDVIFTNPPFKGIHKMCREILCDKQYVLIIPYACIPAQIVVAIADGKLFIEPHTVNIWNHDNTKGARCNIISSFKPVDIQQLASMTFTGKYDKSKHLHFKNIKEPYDILLDIVNCDKMKDFPTDYDGIVAVPQSAIFYVANLPQQFQIVGMYEKKSHGNTYLNDGKFFYVSIRDYVLENGKMPFIRLLVKYTGDRT